ncbi:transcriptional regulator, TraR/DksA family [Micrococcales bacterium KH10]|nr:transcriptional regulator, TraR/DksA family [Micrococcales bacterium KH10]
MTTSQQDPNSEITERFSLIVDDPASFAVRDGERPWTADELTDVCGELLVASERLAKDIEQADRALSDMLRNSGDGAGDDQADSGASALEREHELSILNNSRDLQAQNSHALERIRVGTYGNCEQCGEAIGKARLRAFPRATLCVTCKQRQERR